MKFLLSIYPASVLCLLFVCSTADDDKNGLQRVQSKICECINYDCGCCAQLYVRDIIDGRLCANFSYLSEEIGASATVTYNNLVIINETISARNPPRLCILHIDEIKMHICLRLYNMNYTNGLSGCAEFDIEFFHIIPLKKINLGCFGHHSRYIWNSILNTFYIKDKSEQHNKQPNVVLI
ncbi:uncharacterized protein LOC106637150 [Copidosoma floridanum]|uniref:uncharacterized protein LOC106637150 n=1 Tax=Copidosoma floridanum TaxID=29053 RepID=UPI0006C94794|nr:uncharacterized protein LOC106637150 [Copidosoma floridanum]